MTPPPPTPRLALLVVLALALAAAPSFAHADTRPCAAEAETVGKMKQRDPSLTPPTDAAAQKHIEAAKRAYGVGEFDKAIEEYTAAGLIVDSPLVLYNMAQTFRAAKQYEKAIRQYRLFLDRGQPGSEVRVLVECHIRTMTAELEHAAASAPPEGPSHDGASATEPTAEPVAESEPVPVDEPAPSRWTGTRKVSVGVAGLGVVAAGVGVVFGVQSAGFKDDAEAICPSNPCARADEANELSDRASSRATMANVLYGVGGAFVVGGAILWFVGGPDSDKSGEADETAHILPMLSPNHAGITFHTRF